MSGINKDNFKIFINGKEIHNIDYGSVHVDHLAQVDASVCSFEVGRDQVIRKGDEIKVYFQDNLEVDGEVAKVTKNIKCLKILASSIREKDLPDKKTGFIFANNWGTGALIVLAFVANKQAGVGIIIFNFGFYIGTKLVDKKTIKRDSTVGASKESPVDPDAENPFVKDKEKE